MRHVTHEVRTPLNTVAIGADVLTHELKQLGIHSYFKIQPSEQWPSFSLCTYPSISHNLSQSPSIALSTHDSTLFTVSIFYGRIVTDPFQQQTFIFFSTLCTTFHLSFAIYFSERSIPILLLDPKIVFFSHLFPFFPSSQSFLLFCDNSLGDIIPPLLMEVVVGIREASTGKWQLKLKL